MTYSDFIDRVKNSCYLTRDEAEVAIRATLQTLSERLEPGVPEKLTRTLPPELAQYFRAPRSPLYERFSLEEFYARVRERQGVGTTRVEAVYQSRAIAGLLADLLPTPVLNVIRATLPGEFSSLFDSTASLQFRTTGTDDTLRTSAS
jgi:uncharacterized protein (DUF2267 family)